MCGILYLNNLDGRPANQAIRDMYKHQRERGTQGFGWYSQTRKQTFHTPNEQEAIRKLKSVEAQDLLFHHRMPTSTDNVLNACHPFTISGGKNEYVFVHNGYLYNQYDLKAEHDKLGIVYSSMQPDGRFNDSEALAYDVARYLDGNQTELKANGAIAFVAIRKRDGHVFFARNTASPLYLLDTKRKFTLRSKGRGASVPVNTLHEYNNLGQRVSTAALAVPEYTSYAKPSAFNSWSNWDGLASYDYDVQEKADELYDRYGERAYDIAMRISGQSASQHNQMFYEDVAGELYYLSSKFEVDYER